MKGFFTKALQLILGIAIFVLVLYLGNLEGLNQIYETNLTYIFWSFIATGVLIFFASYRWQLVVKSLGGKGPLLDFLYFLLIGRALGNFTPRDTTDVAVRSASLKMASHFPIKKGIYSIMIDKLFDLIIFVSMLIPAILFLLGYISLNFSITISIILVLVSGVIFHKYQSTIFRLLIGVYNFLLLVCSLFPIIRKYASKSEKLNYRELGESNILRMYSITLLKFIANCFSKYFIILAIGLNLPFLAVLMGTTISQLASLISFTPGALGILEAGWYAVLIALSVSSAEITLFLILQRVANFFSILILTLFVYIIRIFNKN